jgi:hypothetical protein
MRTLFWGPLERAIFHEMSSDTYPKLGKLNKILVLGSNDPEVPIDGLSYSMELKPGDRLSPEHILNPLREKFKSQRQNTQVSQTENASQLFGVKDDAEFREVLKKHVMSTAFLDEEDITDQMLDEICSHLPQVQTRTFSMKVEDRLALINRAVSSVIPSRAQNLFIGLSSEPIERESVDLRIDPRKFSIEAAIDDFAKSSVAKPIDIKTK